MRISPCSVLVKLLKVPTLVHMRGSESVVEMSWGLLSVSSSVSPAWANKQEIPVLKTPDICCISL